MNYRDFEIKAELRIYESWSIDESGEPVDITGMPDKELDGYYAVSPDGIFTDNADSIDEVKRQVDLQLAA